MDNDKAYESRYGFVRCRVILNDTYRAISEETGAVYANVFSVLTDEKGNFQEDLTNDGLYPNAKGFVRIIGFLKPILSTDA